MWVVLFLGHLAHLCLLWFYDIIIIECWPSGLGRKPTISTRKSLAELPIHTLCDPFKLFSISTDHYMLRPLFSHSRGVYVGGLYGPHHGDHSLRSLALGDVKIPQQLWLCLRMALQWSESLSARVHASTVWNTI